MELDFLRQAQQQLENGEKFDVDVLDKVCSQ
jgi:hypothetical protein